MPGDTHLYNNDQIRNFEAFNLKKKITNYMSQLCFNINNLSMCQVSKKNTERYDSSECQEISQSYKDLLFNHILYMSDMSQGNKQNLLLSKSCKKQNKNISFVNERKILSQIPVDIGSLSEFMGQQNQNRILYTSKKKRNDNIGEETKLRKLIALSNQEQKILTSKNSTNYEKKLASKVIADKVFEDIFKMPVQDFYNINTKKQSKNKELINIATLENLLLQYQRNLGCQKQNLQQISLNFKKSCEITQSFQLNNLIQSVQAQKQEINRNLTKVTIIDFQAKRKEICHLKDKYYDLRKIQIPKSYQLFSLLIQPQSDLDQYLKEMSSAFSFNKRNSSLLFSAKNSLLMNGKFNLTNKTLITQPMNIKKRMQEISQKLKKSNNKTIIYPNESIAKITQEELTFKKIEFRDIQMGLYMINYINFQSLKIIRLENLRISTNLLCLFFDVAKKYAPKQHSIKQLSISAISVENTLKLSDKITQFLQSIKVIKLFLNYLDLGSKEFAKICLGISSSSSLIQEIQLKNNHIDFMGVKSLQSILKICTKLKRIDLRNNEISKSVVLKDKDERVIL